MRRGEREAWTALIEGRKPAKRTNKYGAQRTGRYASKHESEAAAIYHALERRGLIWDLEEQKRILLVEGKGRVRPITYVADFVFTDRIGTHVVDAKGFKTPVYRLKKKLASLLLGIEIEEV